MHDVNSNNSNDYNDIPHNSRSDLDDYTIIKKKIIPVKGIPVGRLPSEILNFVKNESYSLLVKGSPGTGKTTFALTLMDNLTHDSNYFYITTRLSVKQLLFYYPWIKKFTFDGQRKFEYKFEDARLDEPESLFERITNQLMDVKSPIIIIDTWDTIATFMDKESRLNNERVLQIWRERAGAKLVFLSETFDLGILDSIVDGVVTLDSNIIGANRYRQLFINKLRGTPINCPSYYFTLHKGLFFTFDTVSTLNLFSRIKTKKTINFKNKIPRNIYFNKQRKYKHKDNLFIDQFISDNRIIIMNFDSVLGDEMVLSTLLSHIYFWLASNVFVMVNNFSPNFNSLLEKLMQFYIPNDVIKKNLLLQKIDFSKIITSNDYYKSYNYYHNDFNTEKPLSQSHLLLENEILSNFYNIDSGENIKNNVISKNIINIMDGHGLSRLLSNNNFLELINKSFTTNLIILKNNYDMGDMQLLDTKNYYKIILKGNNVIIKPTNPELPICGAFIEDNNYFINWHPFY